MASCQNLDLSIENLFLTGNQMIDPRIRFANGPGFTHEQGLLNPSTNRAS